MARRFSRDRDAVLKGLFGQRYAEEDSSFCEATFDLGRAFDFALIARYPMLHQGAIA